MSKTKAPAYQWYPTDFMADGAVVPMTLEEEGAYRRLLDSQWLNGFIPNEMWDIASICKHVPMSRMRKLWVRIGPLFPETSPGQLQNGRLERVRNERVEFVQSQVDKANARWEKERLEKERQKNAGAYAEGMPGHMPDPVPDGIPGGIPERCSPSPSPTEDLTSNSPPPREARVVEFMGRVRRDTDAIEFLEEFEGVFHASPYPSSQAAEFIAMLNGINMEAGRPATLTAIGQAIRDIRNNREPFNSQTCRVYTAKILRPKAAPRAPTHSGPFVRPERKSPGQEMLETAERIAAEDAA